MPFLSSICRLGLAGRIILSVALGLAAVSSLFGYLAMAAVQQSKDQVLQQRAKKAWQSSGIGTGPSSGMAGA